MPAKATVSAVVPVYRGIGVLPGLLTALRSQTLACDELLIIETEPTPEIRRLARTHDARYIPLAQNDFDHAGTRTRAAETSTGDVLVYLTQDVLPAADSTLETLVGALLSDPAVGAAYGRQVSDNEAHPVTAVKRLFNYPDRSQTKSEEDRAALGLRTPFLSNAFAAYRRTALEQIGFFGQRLLICEDVRAGALLLQAGWSIRYSAGAVVHHTHDFNLAQEFRRYFDIGVAHRREQWVLDHFGGSDREGLRYLRMGADHLRRVGRTLSIPEFVLRSVLGRAAYALGRHHRRLPSSWNRRLSSFPLWWDRPEPGDIH